MIVRPAVLVLAALFAATSLTADPQPPAAACSPTAGGQDSCAPAADGEADDKEASCAAMAGDGKAPCAPITGDLKASSPLLAGDEEAGRSIFASTCRSCHSGTIAPSLSGVVGRQVASAPGYGYTDGLKARDGEAWSPENLDAFLMAPQSFAPGSGMYISLEDPQQRADLITYLNALSASE